MSENAETALAESTEDTALTESTEELAQQPVQKVGSGRSYRKVREGYVVSDKMAKTIVVELEDRKKHRRYSKVMRRTIKVKAHDEEDTAGPGDRVLLMETRPLSATKRWRLVRVVQKAK